MAEPNRDELNRLYWESDASVADIADRMGLSRRALYDELDPLPAGVPCPECGAALGFRNRTTADSGEAECAHCGHEVEIDDEGPAVPAEQQADAAPLSPTRRVPDSVGAPLAGLFLLIGLALGSAIAYWLRRT